jgi:hypothetical protein
MSLLLFLLRKAPPIPIEEEAGWTPEPVWTFCGNKCALLYLYTRSDTKKTRLTL